MKRKTLIGIAAAAIVGGGIFLLMRRKKAMYGEGPMVGAGTGVTVSSAGTVLAKPGLDRRRYLAGEPLQPDTMAQYEVFSPKGQTLPGQKLIGFDNRAVVAAAVQDKAGGGSPSVYGGLYRPAITGQAGSTAFNPTNLGGRKDSSPAGTARETSPSLLSTDQSSVMASLGALGGASPGAAKARTSTVTLSSTGTTQASTSVATYNRLVASQANSQAYALESGGSAAVVQYW